MDRLRRDRPLSESATLALAEQLREMFLERGWSIEMFDNEHAVMDPFPFVVRWIEAHERSAGAAPLRVRYCNGCDHRMSAHDSLGCVYCRCDR